MSKRKYREGAQAKRLSPDDIALALAQSCNGPSESLQADLAYNAHKNDPLAHGRKLHAMHQEEVRMARTMLGFGG